MDNETQINLHCSEAFSRLLSQTGNKSEYVRRSVSDRMARYKKARAIIRSHGYQPRELKDVFVELEPRKINEFDAVSPQVATQMQSGEVPDDMDERLARSLYTLSKEYWSGTNDHMKVDT